MRRNAGRQPVGVALFPFLAVLICTMGALIVLLVLFVQQARVDASTIARQAGAPGPESDSAEARQQLEDAQWRRELMEQTRQEKLEELADARARLAHLEEHLERLKTEASELLQRANAIDEGRRLRDEELAAAREELARLTREIERKKAELETARMNHAEGEQWYALVPYEGRHGTRRRPIYIECTDSGIVIQPERLVLGPEDFQGPLGPGNPLDAALRTIREHMQQVGGGQAGEPYPLLVVRPGGVVAYTAARAALSAWDDEFGYELISNDKKLDFGTPDPALASTLERSVAAARQRQTAMAAMMPRRYQDDEPLTSFASESLPQVAAARAAASGRGLGSGGGAGSSDGAGAGSARGAGLPSVASAAGDGVGLNDGREARGTAGWENGGGASGGGSALAAGQWPAAAAGEPAGSSGGGKGGSGGSQSQASGPAGGASGSLSTSGPQGMGVPTPNVQFGASPTAAAKGAKSKSSGGSSSAGGRGSNWGLPGARGRTTAVTRPIHIAVLADRIVIVPERGDDRPPQQLAISPELTQDDVNRFVTSIQREIDGWGLAVASGYWKPELQVEVAPDAERHFDNLRRGLEGSGFDIVRKSR